ncbi:MAG: bifunctional metallophosphatase/5'-nucleotidase [Opitutae bacterium]|nr:bifunctional metallophosphatase/5'-nucleotidase [Opitutae bacterium]
MHLFTRRQFTKIAALSPLVLHQLANRARADIGKLGGGAHELTLLYTNDFHSAFEPIPAYWLHGAPKLGGAAHLAALVGRERAAARTSFLLDSGDMFTGTMSHLTHGEALMEMMTLMRYDAMSAGNHEFDYGWRIFDHAMQRVPFPILCCNIRHKGTGIRFTRPYAILERNGARVGIIGVMGLMAAHNTIMPSKVAELEFTDPVAETRACVAELRDTVDVLVVLGHMGLPGAMQTDAENDPEVQRPLDEDIGFCGAVPNIDVYIAAHSHHGLDQPIIQPDTGTIITQTYGYGTRLGRIRLKVKDRKVVAHDVELLKVWSDDLAPDPVVAARVEHYRGVIAPQIGAPFGRATARIIRKYNRESPLGDLIADAMRRSGGADAALTNAGGLRADIPEGPIDHGRVLDAFPFLNDNVVVELPGAALRGVVEHGLSLQAGMCQVSGLRATYDLKRPVGARLVSLEVSGQPVAEAKTYRIATNSFLAEGGDGYAAFLQGRVVARGKVLSDVLSDYIRERKTIEPPVAGRLVPA